MQVTKKAQSIWCTSSLVIPIQKLQIGYSSISICTNLIHEKYIQSKTKMHRNYLWNLEPLFSARIHFTPYLSLKITINRAINWVIIQFLPDCSLKKHSFCACSPFKVFIYSSTKDWVFFLTQKHWLQSTPLICCNSYLSYELFKLVISESNAKGLQSPFEFTLGYSMSLFWIKCLESLKKNAASDGPLAQFCISKKETTITIAVLKKSNFIFMAGQFATDTCLAALPTNCHNRLTFSLPQVSLTLRDFNVSNARRFYLSMGTPPEWKG